MKRTRLFLIMVALIGLGGGAPRSFAEQPAAEPGLVGHWKLQGDCRDSSGKGNHGVNHGVKLDATSPDGGLFDGNTSYIEVPSSDSLRLGVGDFALCAWVHTEKQLDDIVGDVLDLYDPAARRGITLCVNSSAGGYQSHGTDRHVAFGVDNARASEWRDCGRPNPTSNYVSNSLTAFKGKLYAGTSDGADPKDWCHVYRYEGGEKWADCGHVGEGKTTGVGPLIVHQGDLYAVTTTYDWTRVQSGGYDPARVYRYAGGTKWEDCGQPSENRTIPGAASYRGKLYVGGGPNQWGVFTQVDVKEWKASKLFPMSGPRKCYPHALTCFDGKLFVAYPSVYTFDGEQWTYAGVPSPPEKTLQTHSLQVYQGQLCAGTWPLARVAVYQGGENWKDIGRVGAEGTEVNALVVYNGKLYGGSIPEAEVCRYDDAPQWTSLKKFYAPEGSKPAPPIENGGNPTNQELNDWSRVTSLTVHDGRLFASIGNCTSAMKDSPLDARGKVFSMEAGKCASYDDDLGPGWKHLAAIRQGGQLKLYIDGKLAASSTKFDPAEYDVSTDRPLRIGFGQSDYFHGKIADVRMYNKALTDGEIQKLSAARTP